jgi:hypothetical protein
MSKPKHGLAPDFRGPIGVKPGNHDAIAGRDPPKSCAAAPHLRVGNECRDVVHYPDLTVTPNLTGRWVDTKGRFNLFVNQAGPHLECLLALVVNGNRPKVEEKKDGDHIDERGKELCFRLLADRLDEKNYLLAWRDDHEVEHGLGLLEVDASSDELGFKLDDGQKEDIQRLQGAKMSRLDDRPSLFERYVGAKSVSPSIRSAYWFPLTPQQEAFLPRHIIRFRGKMKTASGTVQATLEQMIRAWINLERDHEGLVLDGHRQTKAEEIDQFVLDAVNAAQTTPVEDGGIHEFQQPSHGNFAVTALAAETMVFLGERRSLYEMLTIILERIPRLDRIRHIPKYLHIDGRSTKEYEAELVLKTTTRAYKKFLRGGFVEGELELVRLNAPVWEAKYRLFGVTAGVEHNDDAPPIKLKGKSTFAGTWLPEQIPGPFFSTDVSITAFGTTRAFVLLTLIGSGPGRPKGALALELEAADKGKGLGGKISGMTHVGSVTMVGNSKNTPDITPSTGKKEMYTFALDGEHQHVYATNNATLTPEDQARLNRFVATELVAFSDPSTEKTVVGHADRPHTDEDNLELSRHRADTVVNYLQAILGRDIDAGENPSNETQVIPRGSEEARELEGDSPVRPNMKFRRVDLYIRGELLFSTRGALEK